MEREAGSLVVPDPLGMAPKAKGSKGVKKAKAKGGGGGGGGGGGAGEGKVDAPPNGLPVSCSSAGDARTEEPVPAPVHHLVAADPVLLGQMLLDPSHTLEVAREGRERLEEVFDNALRRSFALGDEGVYMVAAAAAKLLPSAPHLLSMSRKHLRSL